MITLEFLKERVNASLEHAKELLVSKGQVMPVVIFGKEGEGEMPQALDFSSNLAKDASGYAVRQTILQAEADYAIHISDAYMRRLKAGEQGDEFLKNYRRGSLAEDTERVEVLIAVGGSTLGYYSMLQPYHREGERIVFDKPEVTGGLEARMQSALFGDVWEKRAAMEAESTTRH